MHTGTPPGAGLYESGSTPMQINANAQACINVGSAHIPEIPEPHVGVTWAHGRCLYCVHKLYESRKHEERR